MKIGSFIFVVDDQDTSTAILNPLRAVGIVPEQHCWLALETVEQHLDLAESLAKARADNRVVVAVGNNVGASLSGLGIGCSIVPSPHHVLTNGKIGDRMAYLRALKAKLDGALTP